MNTMPVRPLDASDAQYAKILAAHAERERKIAEAVAANAGPPEPSFMPTRSPHATNQDDGLEGECVALGAELQAGVSMARAVEIADRLREIENELRAAREEERQAEPEATDPEGAENSEPAENSEGAEPKYMPVRGPYAPRQSAPVTNQEGPKKAFVTCRSPDLRVRKERRRTGD